MKRTSSFRIFFTGGLLVMLFSACKKNQEPVTTARPTILNYIASDPQLSLLNKAILRCGLDTAVFSGGGPYTFFCPVDSAFLTAGLNADSIGRYNRDSLSRILKYHILSGKFSSQDIIGFLTETVTSLDTVYKPYISKNYFGIFLDGIGVTEGDLSMGDGVIQKIKKVAFPPQRTILQTIDSLPELSYFSAVVHRVPQFVSLLGQFQPSVPNSNPPQGYPGVTVLAPTNSAFQTSFYPSIDAINQEDPAILYSVMSGYFLNGFKFTSDFLGGFQPGNYNNNNSSLPELFGGSNYKIDKDGLTVIPSYPVGVTPRIVQPDRMCIDGVVQEISEVFIAN